MDNEKILEIVLKARDEASKVIAGVGDQVEKSTKQVMDLQSTFKIAGGVMLTAGLAGIGAMKMLADAGAEQQVAMASVEATLKNVAGTIGSFETLKKTTEDLGTAYMKLGFEDDETQLAFAQDLRVTKDVANAKIMMATATDLARLKHMSLAEATQMLTMAYEGNHRALKTLGIEVDAHAKGMDTINAVEKAASGQAEAFSKTWEGATARLDVNIKQLKESLGARLIPSLTDFTEKISAVIERLNKLSPQTYDTIINVLKFGTAFALVGGAILLFLGFLPAVAAGFGLISGALLPIALILAGVSAAAFLLYKNWDNVTRAFEQARPYIQTVLDQLSKFWVEIQPKLEAAWNAIKIKIDDLAKFIKDHWDQIKIVIEIALGVIMTFLIVWWELFKTVIKVALDAISGNWKAVWDDINGFFIGVWDDMNALTGGKLDEILKNIEKFIGDAIAKFKSMAAGITNALHEIKFPHLSIGEGDINVAGHDIKYPKLDVQWYEPNLKR
ncbi:hypothetical protein M1345_00335 [Patescibacteria group bacterium]|nr:hypothetical protein [Patescibacteria group bacterium]